MVIHTLPAFQKMEGKVTQDFWLVGLIAESVLAYLFWSTFYVMIYTVWWMPMSIMTVTEGGTEFIFLICYLSGIFLGIPFLGLFLSHYQTVGFLLCLVGIPSSFTSSVVNRFATTVRLTYKGDIERWWRFFWDPNLLWEIVVLQPKA
jgi:hypothetical protein